jgi:hypothetical protein
VLIYYRRHVINLKFGVFRDRDPFLSAMALLTTLLSGLSLFLRCPSDLPVYIIEKSTAMLWQLGEMDGGNAKMGENVICLRVTLPFLLNVHTYQCI